MALTNYFKSGSQIDSQGNALGSAPVAPSTFVVTARFAGAVGSTAAGSFSDTSTTRHIFVADAPCQVVAVTEEHSVLGSTTGMLVNAVGSTPLGSGSNVLASTIDHASTVDIANLGTVIQSTSLTQLSRGDSLGWRFTTPGNLPPVGSVVVTLQRI